MSRNYFLSVLVGIIIFMWIFWYTTKEEKVYRKEGFTGETSSSPAASPSTAGTVQDPGSIANLVATLDSLVKSLGDDSVTTNFPYTEDIDAIPNKKHLQIYLSTFSDKTVYDDKVPIYMSQSQKWNNFVKEDQAFMIVTGDALPATIKVPNGLPLKNKVLNGIRSDEINKLDYLLKSFTANFFLRFNTITFTSATEVIEIFRIFVESPNYVSLTIEPIVENSVIDTENVRVSLQVGDASNKYGFSIPIDTLKSNGNAVVLSMVYDGSGTTEGKVKLYIGNTQYEAIVTPLPSLYLGNSKIRMNGYSNLDATLFSFMYYNTPLTLDQHTSIIEYLNKQQSGVAHIVSQLKDITETKLAALREVVTDQMLTTENLREKLNQCYADIMARGPAPQKDFKYKIAGIGGSAVTAADLASCSVLKIKDTSSYRTTAPAPAPAPGPGTTSTPSTSPGPSSTPSSSPAPAPSPGPATNKNPFYINIPFLNNILPKEADLSKVTKGYITNTARI